MNNLKYLDDAKKHIIETSIPGLYVVKRDSFVDNRGGFRMVVLAREIEATLGRPFNFAQLNHSWSKPKVIRGIHPDPWDKLVYPVTGKVFAAIADINPKSPTFKKVETFIFDEDKNEPYGLLITKGLGNSICNFGQTMVHYFYVVNDYWDGKLGSGERGVSWIDQDLKIDWPVKDPIISTNDRGNKSLREHFEKDYPELFKK